MASGRIRRLAVSGAAPRGAVGVVVPGFHDPHVHLLSAAAARLSVDLTAARSVADILKLLSAAVAGRRHHWIRAWGWDEFALRERRAPTPAELDAVTGGRPCVLHHRTGKLAVLNSTAWRLLVTSPDSAAQGDPIDAASPDAEPPDSVGARDPLLRRIPPLPVASMETALAGVSEDLAARGVTSVTDATATNTLDDVERLALWRHEGVIRQRVSSLIAVAVVDDAAADGLGRTGVPEVGGVKIRGAKIIAPAEDIPDQIRAARRHGWPVAVHATEPDEIEAAVRTIASAGAPRWGRDRIEHLGLPLPGHLQAIAAAGIAVTTNPAFVAERAVKYRESLSTVEQDWLYPVRSALAAGIPTAASSDLPVTEARPVTTMADLVSRRSRDPSASAPLGAGERIGPDDALALVTDRARIDRDPQAAGSDPSDRATRDHDLVVLSHDPRLLQPETTVLASFVADRLIWGPPAAR